MVFGQLVVLFYGVSTLFGSFQTKLSYFDKSFIQFSVVFRLNVKTVLFQTIQSNISTNLNGSKNCYKLTFATKLFLELITHFRFFLKKSNFIFRCGKTLWFRNRHRGAINIMVIIIENRIDNTSSNPRWGCLHFILRFGLVSLFNGISTFVGYLMPMLFS